MTGPIEPPDTEERHPKAQPQSGPPGAAIFSLDGRAAPGLYLVGWLASIMGFVTLLAVVFSGVSGPPAFGLLVGSLLALGVGLVSAAGAQSLERRSRGVAAFWGPSPFLVFGAALVWTVLIAAIVGRPIKALGLDEDSPIVAFVSVSVTAAVYVGLLRLLVVGPGALSWTEMGMRRASLARQVEHLVSGAAFALPVLFLTAILARLLLDLLGVEPESPLPQAHDQLGVLLNLISAGVVAPIGEELFFRGFATSAWARSIGPGRAIVRGAVFFAFVHILTLGSSAAGGAGQAILQAFFIFLVRLPVGLVLGWVFVRRGSIMAPIGLHAAFNTVQIVLAQLLLGVAVPGL